jgi:predicted RNA binding protein YcfA (HicA-like mRNA interferase family)
VKGLHRVGYTTTRQKGDHVYLTTQVRGEHHVAVPLHKPVKVGTFSAILASVAEHFQVETEELLRQMKL